MRLFIAINFSEDVKDALCETIAELRDAALRGRWTARENLHLTLVFIGESDRVDDILDVMEEAVAGAAEDGPSGVAEQPLTITLAGAGVFGGRRRDGSGGSGGRGGHGGRGGRGRRSRGGGLHWVGVENTPALKSLARRLADGLRAEGFDIERRRFTPHITIGREVVLTPEMPDADAAPVAAHAIRVHPARMAAGRISLMRSERVDGRMVYTEIAAVSWPT